MSEEELMLLALLHDAPHFGNELQHKIDTRGLRAWLNLGYSSIYYLLNRLEKQHLVSSALVPNPNGAPRKQYTITNAGRGVLQTAVADLLRQARPLGSGFELGLANLHVLDAPQVYALLSAHRTDLEQRLIAIDAQQREQLQTQTHKNIHNIDLTLGDALRALYGHHVAVLRAEVVWLAEFLRVWAEQYPQVQNPLPPPAPRPSEQPPQKQMQRLRRPPKSD
jgi:DNA-binding PadR family transcriptional regulator